MTKTVWLPTFFFGYKHLLWCSAEESLTWTTWGSKWRRIFFWVNYPFKRSSHFYFWYLKNKTHSKNLYTFLKMALANLTSIPLVLQKKWNCDNISFQARLEELKCDSDGRKPPIKADISIQKTLVSILSLYFNHCPLWAHMQYDAMRNTTMTGAFTQLTIWQNHNHN